MEKGPVIKFMPGQELGDESAEEYQERVTPLLRDAGLAAEIWGEDELEEYASQGRKP